MTEKHTKGEIHGCIVCGKPYQMYVVYDEGGKFFDCKVMSPGGVKVKNEHRPLVACESHTSEQVEAAVRRAYGTEKEEE